MSKLRFRGTYILLGVFVILLLIVVFFENEAVDKKKVTGEQDSPFFTESQVLSIDKIIFSRKTQMPEAEEMVSSEDLSITKSDIGDWMIETYALDSIADDKLSEYLLAFPLGKLVSNNKENWDKYGLTDEKSQKAVLFSSDQEIANLYFGSMGLNYGTVHVRRNLDEKVYLVDADFSQFFSYDLNSWRNKQLFNLEKDEIVSVTVRVVEDKWVFNQAAGNWYYATETGEKDISELTEEFDKYIDDILALKATGFEIDMDKYVEADNAIALILTDGSEQIVSIDNNPDQAPGYFAIVTGQSDLMLLASDYSGLLKPNFLDDLVSPEDEIISADSAEVDTELVE